MNFIAHFGNLSPWKPEGEGSPFSDCEGVKLRQARLL